MFLEMCILSGCDYLPSLPTIGIKKAYAYMKQYQCISKIIRKLRFDGKIAIPMNYEVDFMRAKHTFYYQYVYDPIKKCMTHLQLSFNETIMLPENLDFLGNNIKDQNVMIQIAKGMLHPSYPYDQLQYPQIDTSLQQYIDQYLELKHQKKI